jgi:hypothetical protein
MKMKINNIFGLFIIALVLSSCGARVNNPEELTVPIIQAIQSDNVGKLDCMLPPYSEVNPVFASNKGTVGWVYYNKYTQDYREKALRARVRTNMDIIKTISADNQLDWETATYTAPTKEDINDSLSGYTIVTTHLKFSKGGEYELKYHTAQSNGKWYLLDDIYFGTKQEDKKLTY